MDPRLRTCNRSVVQLSRKWAVTNGKSTSIVRLAQPKLRLSGGEVVRRRESIRDQGIVLRKLLTVSDTDQREC